MVINYIVVIYTSIFLLIFLVSLRIFLNMRLALVG